jgi:cyclopropane-fatty-acyl-phospholipid synthase
MNITTEFRNTNTNHLSNIRAILKLLFGPVSKRSFAVQFYDGSVDEPSTHPRFTLELHRPGALRRMLMPGTELSLGEAFVRNDFDVTGDLTAAVSLETQLNAGVRSPLGMARLLPKLLALPTDDVPPEAQLQRPGVKMRGQLHDKQTDADHVRAHYDLNNDFYALFLDNRMVYSCAYFETGTEDIDTAQAAKLELICKKLRLQPGERLLDIGCGWGGLAIYAAQRYGVNAVGITLSEPQAAHARERINALNLEHLVRIEVRDYRDMPKREQFDKIVSVGMVEHVGKANLGRYFKECSKLLKPGGLFLCHGIVDTTNPLSAPFKLLEQLTWRGQSFLYHYVFPGGEVNRPSAMLSAAEQAGFETRDLESLREHYALTARHWTRRLEAQRDAVIGLVGEKTYRVYRLYLAAVAYTFDSRRNGLNQILLAKPMPNGTVKLPLTRADLFRASEQKLERVA